MTKVFFGGSRKLSHLNHPIRQRADNIVANGLKVLIGDAHGADKAMQKYLAEKGYKNVIVFCMDGACRNNIGNWQTKTVASRRNKKDFSYFAEKDNEMSNQADYGFMLWDGSSVGTLNNIINLLQADKYVLVYFSPDNEFVTLKTLSQLENLLRRCDPISIQRFNRTLRIHEHVLDPDAQNRFKLT